MKNKISLLILALCAASAVWGTTVTKTAKTIASEQGWETKNAYAEFALDDVITCTTYGTNGYYSADSPNDWRIYQSRENGKFVISAKEGYIIKSITLTYGKKNETDIVARNCGTNIIEANRLVSGQSYAINATSVTLFSANTSTATNAQARISQFSVVYEPICAIEEAFTNVIQTSAAGANTKWDGDYAEWNVTSVRRAETDTLAMGIQGTWSNNNESSAFLQTTNAEGGVKHISFIWRQWGVESGATLKMNVQVGSTFDKTSQTTGVSAAAAAPFMLFDEEVGCKENAQIKITNTSIKNTKTGRTTFRDLIITPYLRYTEKAVSVDIANETYDCTPQINNTETNSITYSSDNACVSFDDANIPTAKLNSTGTAVITATYGDGASTTFELTVTQKPQAEITFANQSVDLDKTFIPTIEVKVEDQTITPSITYSSNNDNVLKVNNGVFEVIGIGTAEVTATVEGGDDYRGNTAKATITVNNITPATGTAWKETFKDLDNASSWVSTLTSVYGDENVIRWKLRQYQHKNTDADKVGGDRGIRLHYNSTDKKAGYIEYYTDKEVTPQITSQEGGIKRLQFQWRLPENSSNPTFAVQVGDVKRTLNYPNALCGGTNIYEYAQNFNETKNTKLTISVPQESGCSVIFGPITITPYLLYTKKEVEVEYNSENLTSYDATQNLINNTGEPPTIALSDGASATVDGTMITLDNKTEDITVTASWNEGKVTTTFTLKVKKEPVYPDVSFELGDAVNKTMNDVPFVNAITAPTEGLGTIAYSSTDPTVAEVDENGQVTIIGAGETEIKLAIDASDTYDATEVKYTLTVTEPTGEDAYIETFKAYETEGWPSSLADETDRTGDDATITWKAKLSRHKTDDKLKNGDRSTWFAQNGYIKTNFEGGIKRIAFQWNKFTASTADITLAVSAGDKVVNATYSFEATTGVNQVDPDINFNQNFFVQKNVELQIKNVSATDYRAQVGPIKITPYLFYKTKYVEVMKSAGPYVNTDIINNTNGEGTITFESSDPGTAYIFTGDELHPDKVVFVKTGTVTITATWEPYKGAKDAGEYVTTSYTLKINDREYSDAYFEVSKVEKKLGDKFTYAVTRTKGEGDVEYSSDDPTIAEVNASTGEVTVHRIGTTKIKAHVDGSAQYYAWDGSYTLVVRTGIDENKKLVEKFTQMPDGLIQTTGGKDVTGDIGIDWHAYYARRGENDLISAGVQGNNIFATGYIDSKTPIEGGVKYFSFNWKQWATEQGATLKLVATINDAEYPMEYKVTDPSGATTNEQFFFAQNVFAKKNTTIKLENKSYNTQSGEALADKGRIVFDAFEIVPYLFYKTKYHKMDVANGDPETWTNTDLINNTDDGTIVYSVPEGNGVATIDLESGEVTAEGNGITTVTATWTPADALEGEVVTTTYEVEVFYSKLDAELAFDPEEISVGVDAIAFSTPTLSNPHNLTVTYSSNNEEIATVNENGEVTLIGVVGDVVIYATSDETGTYQEGNASYTIHVLPLPDVSFPYLTGNKKTVDMDQVPFTETILIKVNEEDVTSSAEITYRSDNKEVAIIKDNKVNIIGVGKATITAEIALKAGIYAGRDVYYTLTVEDDTPAEKQWTETFSSIGNVNNYIESRTADIVGDSSIYSWAMRNYRRKQVQADSLATEQAIRLRNKNPNYIETLNNQEGGIKRISFNWRTPGAEEDQLPINLNVSVCYNNNYQDTVKRPMTRAKSKDNMTDNSYCSNFFVKQNAKLKIDIADETYSVMLIGPITITPYLLYTTKTATLNLTESSTYKNEDLINNLELGDEVTYSIIKGNEGSIASIETDGTVTATAAGEITIQAKWTDGDNTITTTYKLKIEKHITISESADNSAILAANDGKTVDVKIVRSALVANTWNSLCLPFDIEKSELGDAKVAILDRATLEDDVLNIWLATVTGETLTAGTPYLVLPSENIDLSKTYENKLIVAEEGNQEVYMVTLHGIFSPFEMTANDETKLFLGQPDAAGHNLFYASENGYLKGMRAYFSINTPSGAPVRVGRIGIQQTPTELGGEADRLNGRQAMKVLRDGQFYIIRETKTYNAQGIEIQ